MQDEEFFADHLKATVRHNQVAPERDSARESTQHNQNPQRISLLSPQDAVESNEQTQNEQMQETARTAQLQDSIQQDQNQVQSELQHQQSTLQDFIKTMKKRVKRGTEQPKDLKQPIRPNPGEGPKPKDLKIDEIYTNLKIQEGRAKYDFPTDRGEQLKISIPNTTRIELSLNDRKVLLMLNTKTFSLLVVQALEKHYSAQSFFETGQATRCSTTNKTQNWVTM